MGERVDLRKLNQAASETKNNPFANFFKEAPEEPEQGKE